MWVQLLAGCSLQTDKHAFQRLGLPCMYGIPHFPQRHAAQSIARFTERIRSSDKLADLVRVLYCEELPEPLPVPVILRNLVHVSHHFRVFPALAGLLPDDQSSPLRWMAQQLTGTESISPLVFLKLPQLEMIILHGGQADGGGIGELADALPRLANLGLTNVDASLLDMFASIKCVLCIFSYQIVPRATYDRSSWA